MSISSVLKNSIKPGEFLIIVDGNISKNKKIYLRQISKKNDNCNVIFSKKIGLSKILNLGIKKSKFNIIARADADDINHPERFKRQLSFFKMKNADLVGCNMIEKYKKLYLKKKIIERPNLIQILFKNPFNHPTVIFKKNKIIKLGCYPDMPFKEDYYLWIMAKFNNYKMYNLNKSLVSSLIDEKKNSRRKNFLSILSELKLFYSILVKRPFLLPVLTLATLLRISFLLLPNYLYMSGLINLFRQKLINE